MTNAEPDNPLDYLDNLVTEGEIGASQRDAGEILRRLGQHAISDQAHSATVAFPWRYANGIWTNLFEPKRLVIERYEAALAAAANDTQRRDLNRALVAREPEYPQSPTQLAHGLKLIAKAWWGDKALTVATNGVTLAAVAAPANDNAPTPERLAKQTGRDNFERLYNRGQLDDDKDVAETLYAAGLRYETEYALGWSGMYGSPDYSKPVVDGGGEAPLPISERQQGARDRVRVARKAMTAKYAEVVEAVVVNGESLSEVGLRVCGYKSEKMAVAAVKERLNIGLRALAFHYGLHLRSVA
jgi:hypothetical protein